MTFWTDEKQARLVELAATKATVRTIADDLGCTRNAVIGRARRTKVPLLAEPPEGGFWGPRTNRPRAARRKPNADWKGYRGRPKGSSVYTEAEKVSVLASMMAGLSRNRAARSVGAAPQTVKLFWETDRSLVEKAKSVFERAKAQAAAEAAERQRAMQMRRSLIMLDNERILARFNTRNAEIIRRKLNGDPLSVIGQDYGLTRERCRQILMKGIEAGIVAPPGIQLVNERPYAAPVQEMAA